ncbi:CrcB family protein [Humibacter ginsenosidimutans]|uniref:Fluoride-specific ion channel FluC n=2 Tax=Humibacter ginsenosidimutans TaxID=2599293 RepID=A0A5B8MB14_9MICO|nr:CrcB family protein [Humibacter ginsenosidimutans]
MPRSPRPLHLRPMAILIVFVGGAVGTVARFGIAAALPPVHGWPIATLIVNIVGAFLLGALLGGLARRGDESRRGRTLRLLIGTGFMGGFTTYSTLATETAGLFGAGDGWLAAGYSLGTLIMGLAASLAGIAAGTAIARPRADRGPTR